MAKADKSRVVHIVYDETRYDTVTLEIVAQLERELTGLGLKCTYFEKDAPAGAQEIGQKEHYLLNANWTIIVYSEHTEHSSDMFIFEENMVMSEAVNRGELCVIFLIQPFMLNFNTRGFPSVVIQGTDWLDDVVKQVDQSPVQLTSTHFDDIEAYRKIYAELQKARNLTASDPLLYHERSAHYGFPFSQIQTLYFNFLSLISWSSTQAETSSSTQSDVHEPLQTANCEDTSSSQCPTESYLDTMPETASGEDSPTTGLELGTKAVDFDILITSFPSLSYNCFLLLLAIFSVLFATQVAQDFWIGFRVIHCFDVVIAGNLMNFILLTACWRQRNLNTYFNKMTMYNSLTFSLFSVVWCFNFSLLHRAYVLPLSRVYDKLILFPVTFITAKFENPPSAVSVKLYIFILYLVLPMYDFINSSHSQWSVADFHTCPTTAAYIVLKVVELFALFGYLQYCSQCGRSLLSAAIYACFKKKLTFVTKCWGIEVALYYFLYIKNTPCLCKVITSVLKGN